MRECMEAFSAVCTGCALCRFNSSSNWGQSEDRMEKFQQKKAQGPTRYERGRRRGVEREVR